ncbi:MAG: hypothetical protein QOE36_1499 [Gaiellaceae bacterium]|nr:hypothetical protein [Gaiellaceae bacterium]
MSYWRRINPTVRGLLLIAVVAALIVSFERGYKTLDALFLLTRIAFPLAIAFFLFLLWRDRRSEVEYWSTREKAVFYGGAGLIVASLLSLFFGTPSGLFAVAFLATIALSAYAMWRIWRDSHTYA